MSTLYAKALDELAQVFGRLFEVMVLKLIASLKIDPAVMRANHTNLE